MSYEFIPSPNSSSRNGASVDGIVLHFTGGGDINGSIKWLCHPEAKASCHYLVSRSGRIVQIVREDRAAWHAGSPSTTPKLNGRKNLNKWTIGIEICNWGWLYEAPVNQTIDFKGRTIYRKTGERYVRNKKWTTPYQGPHPKFCMVDYEKSKALKYNKKHRNWPGGSAYYWEPYPERQMAAVVSLIKDIVSRYPHIAKEWIATHADVDPTRKLDMLGFGSVFDFNSIIGKVFPIQPEVDKIQLGIREENNTNIEEMKESHTPRNDNKKWWCFT